jgi:hypothetical protein
MVPLAGLPGWIPLAAARRPGPGRYAFIYGLTCPEATLRDAGKEHSPGCGRSGLAADAPVPAGSLLPHPAADATDSLT